MNTARFSTIVPVVLWLCGLAASLMPFEQYETLFFGAAVLLTALSVIAHLFLLKDWNLSLSPLVALGFLFWLTALGSVFFSQAPFVSFLFFWLLSALPLSFLLFAAGEYKTERFRLGGIGLVLVLTGLCASSLVQYWLVQDELFYGLVHWPFDNPNALAGVLSLGFFAALGWLLLAESRVRANLALTLCILLLAAFLTTGSHGASVGMIGGLLVLAVFAPAHIRKHWRCLCIIVVATAAFFTLMSISTPEGASSPAVVTRLTLEGELPWLWSRPFIWQSSWAMIQDHLWLGTGIGTFFLYYPAYRGDDFTSAGLKAHSDPLQFWAEMGIAAPLVFYAFIILAIIRTWKAVSGLGPDDPQRVLILIPFCALGAMIAHAHVSYHFYIMPTLMVSGLLLAFWFGATKTGAAEQGSLLMPRALAALLVFGCLCFAPAIGSEFLAQRAQTFAAQGDMRRFSDNVNKAASISARLNPRPFLMATTVPMGIFEARKDELRASEKQELTDRISGLLDQAWVRNPRMGGVLLARARLALLNDDPEGAEELLLQGLVLNPQHPDIRLLLADLYIRRGRTEEGLALLAKGIEWPGSDRFYLDATRILLENGDIENHKKVMEKIRKRAEQALR